MSRGLAILLLCCIGVVPAAARPVRFFAVGHELRLDDVVTYDAFRARMTALMDAAVPGRATLVQAGVDDVATHLAPVDPAAPADALVVFPEDTGLAPAFIGTRGAAARASSSTAAAIVSLLGPYAAPLGHYAAAYPNEPLVRLLVLALTDTLYRSVYETFRDLAVRYHVHVAVTLNAAPARRVEAATSPDLVATLGDPDEPARAYAYEAVSPHPVNTTFVFAPDGAALAPDPAAADGVARLVAERGDVLRGAAAKAYLTEIEQPPPGNAAGLALHAGAVRDLDVLDTPVGRLGIVISKDAWMPDVNERFAVKGANVILQPEAFSSWAYDDVEWSPDVFAEGGFANLQQHPELVTNVDASMTGNLLDVTFDGQSAILGRRQKRDPGPLSAANAWIGRNADTGFLAVAPWIVPDPGIADPSLTLAERRARLAAAGAPLLPGSGIACGGPLVVGSCEGGYREAVVWADVDVPDGAVTAAADTTHATPPVFRDSVAVAPPDATVVRSRPRIATRGRRVFVVWEEAAPGAPGAVKLAVSRNGGRRFGRPVTVEPPSPAPLALGQRNPAIAVRGTTVAVVWQQSADQPGDDQGTIAMKRFDTRGRPRGRGALETVARPHAASGPAAAWLPSVAFVGRSPAVAWIDERDQDLVEGDSASGAVVAPPFEHVYAAFAAPRPPTAPEDVPTAVRVDAGDPVPTSTHHDNKWAPSIVAKGRSAWTAWIDFRNYNWDVFLARSDDGGTTWGANVRVDDFPDFERLNQHPVLAVARDGTLHVAWTDLRARKADTDIRYTRSRDGGATFEPSRVVDGADAGRNPDHDPPAGAWHPTMAVDGDAVFLAWQDDRLGNADVFFTASTDGGTTFAASERADDSGDGPSLQTRPDLALLGRGRNRRCLVVWEDDRSGVRDVRLASRACATRRPHRRG